MIAVMDFIEQMSIDDQLYWRVPDIYHRESFEVVWRRTSEELPWRVRRLGTKFWQRVDKAEFVALANREQLDLTVFEQQIAASMVTQAVFAKMFVDQATEIFGHNLLEKAVSDTKEFMLKIKDNVEDVQRQAHTRPNADNRSAKISPPHLSLVRFSN